MNEVEIPLVKEILEHLAMGKVLKDEAINLRREVHVLNQLVNIKLLEILKEVETLKDSVASSEKRIIELEEGKKHHSNVLAELFISICRLEKANKEEVTQGS